MTQFKSHLWVTVAVLVLAFTIWIGNEASRTLPVSVQEPEKALEIERYPDEPVQLVNLRIGTQSVKDRIRQKFKDNSSKWAIDRVTFKEKDDWFKRVSITLRNTSDRPIFGVQVITRSRRRQTSLEISFATAPRFEISVIRESIAGRGMCFSYATQQIPSLLACLVW